MKFTLAFLSLILPAISCHAYSHEPTLDEVYQAANHQQFAKADNMMHQVLAAHPNSAKAHFIAAELLCREGRIDEAKAQLSAAKQIDPELPFVKPSAVTQLSKKLYQ